MRDGDDIDRSIYRFVWRFSFKETALVCVLVAAAQGFYYVTLNLPKNIMNQGIEGKGMSYPTSVLGHFEFDRIGYLLWLCGLFFLAVLVNGGIKQFINSLKGKLGERLLRRLRYALVERILRFPVPHFRKVSSGELIPMVTAEVEQVGGFMGDAYVQPLMQAGMLLTIAIFLFVQNPIMGLAAMSLYPFQAYIVPKLQKRVKELGKERVKAVRKVSERIGETVGGIQEVRTAGTAAWERADYAERFGTIFRIRFDIYQRKSLVKFINNFLNQCAPLLFYSIGGYLVIQGELTLGALVAALTAHKDMTGPWKELLDYYQQAQDAQQKYEQVVEQFRPEAMLPADLQDLPAEPAPGLSGPVVFAGAAVQEDSQTKLLESITLTLEPGDRVALTGPSGGGREALAMTLARLYVASAGSVKIGGRDLARLPDAHLGASLGYVGPSAYHFSASLRENLTYGLRQRPVAGPATRAPARARWLTEAGRAGNLALDVTDEWIDYARAGAADAAAFDARIAHLLDKVDLAEDVFVFGLRGRIDPKEKPAVAEAILTARAAFRGRLAGPDADPALKGLVEPFDPAAYNDNATVAENLLFGTPLDAAFETDALATQPDFLAVLRARGLEEEFVAMGRKVAEIMIELFADLPPGHEFFDRFSFIAADDLTLYQSIVARTAPGADGAAPAVEPDDRARLLGLPLKLVNARHRLGLIDAAFKAKVLEARAALRAAFADSKSTRGKVAFFEPDSYNAAAAIQDNILFGRVAYGQAKAQATVAKAMREMLEALGLRERVFEVGLDFQVGVAGARLSPAQRQKLAFARALAKRPDILVFNDAFAALDPAGQARVLDGVLEAAGPAIVVASLGDPRMAGKFGRTVVLAEGRVAQVGAYAELAAKDGAFKDLLAGG
ncbi:MAG: ABC transporter ATP-binding protein/permease [Tagaea sp.]|nr:ABC transporter ATP-binding protein/permease [Tagaea sp.]